MGEYRLANLNQDEAAVSFFDDAISDCEDAMSNLKSAME